MSGFTIQIDLLGTECFHVISGKGIPSVSQWKDFYFIEFSFIFTKRKYSCAGIILDDHQVSPAPPSCIENCFFLTLYCLGNVLTFSRNLTHIMMLWRYFTSHVCRHVTEQWQNKWQNLKVDPLQCKNIKITADSVSIGNDQNLKFLCIFNKISEN